ncbi:glycoside hydrolase family 88 protein [Ruania halotolerans]|uniref:glycoside hydrolase family 88 protein n=1 Tax=Ruania halotolerans TaxID=2897773 RepID=UPI001E40F4D4|nr:glycoside hydrolase family 88 protein [Ruania halotolerans]UFU07376.1 glycoside hydrolase family 88 protein [Ruania halotolerans]
MTAPNPTSTTDLVTARAPAELAVGLYHHYESIAEVKHYYGLLAIHGLARVADATDDAALWERVETILRRFPDEVDHPRYNFPSYRIGGIPQAYLVATGRMADRRELVREYAEEMMCAPRDDQGIVVMPREPARQRIWIDAAMATSMFLVHTGRALGEQRYLDEAVHQTIAQYDEFLDASNGLLHQCKNFVGPGVRSTDHWSRGNGWGYVALTELLEFHPTRSEHHEGLVDRFVALSHALLPHQSERGLWRQEIPDPTAYEETSGSALFVYGVGVGMRLGILDEATFAEPFERGLHGVVRYGVNPDSSTEGSCPGCLCPGEGEEKGTPAAYVRLKRPHTDEPHSFGPLILALAEAHRRGVTAVHPSTEMGEL